MKLILASNSPRRRELLSKLGYPFEIIPSNCEEITSSVIPTDIVQDLATQKAAEVFKSHSDCVVVGCDTIVDFQGEIFGKPQNRLHAAQMLRALSGNVHYVHTGVCVLSPVGKWLFCDTTKVLFRNLSDVEIQSYVDSGQADGKAGAYGIQDDSCFVAQYDGDYDNVVGLPTYRVKEILEKIYKR